MADQDLIAVASAAGGSACRQADDTQAQAIALGTTRSITNALSRLPSPGRPNALGTPMDCEQAAHTTAKKTAAFTLPDQRKRVSALSPAVALREGGFTLAELLVSISVLALLVFLFAQLLNSAATVTTLGHKRMDTDSQARQLLDRMALDFAQMVKRTDLDFFAKGTTAPNSVGGPMDGTGGQTKNDRIAFFSAVPGYYPLAGAQSPLSLVAYRVNSDSASSSYNKLQRMGKGLVWNGVSCGLTPCTPIVFMPLTIGVSVASPLGTWPSATNSSTSDADYEVIGPQVFRFEYCYLGTDGTRSITPPGFSSLAAIIVDIAVIDPKSKVLLGSTEAQINAQVTTLAAGLSDYAANMAPGQLRTNWQTYLDGITNLPRPAISGIRLYERALYLSPPAP